MFPGRSMMVAAALGPLLAVGAVARAQTDVSLSRAGSGARAAGMGDAFVAVSDDGTAASWNPAGLAQLRQPEFSVVYGISARGLRFSAMRSPDDRLAYSAARFAYANASLEFASGAVPFTIARKPVTLQLDWHRLYQLSGQFVGSVEAFALRDPATRVATTAVDRRLQGAIDLYSVAGGVKLTPRLAVGAGLNFWRGDWTQRTSLVEEARPSAGSAFFTASDDDRLRGHNLTVGLLLNYPSWNVGLVHRASFWSSFQIRGERHSTEPLSDSMDIPAGRFRLPRSIGFGVARRLPARWTAAVSLTHDQWTDAVVDHIPGVSGELNFFDGLPRELSPARDTLSVNVGLEHLLVREGSVVPLRLGFGWEPQGSMDPLTRDPVLYRLVSAGIGYNTNSFKCDAAVQLRWGGFGVSDIYTVRTAAGPGNTRDAIGRADSHEWRVKVSAIYRLPDTGKLREVARKIFG